MWRMTHGDCLPTLRAMEDASVDAVICDPPYDTMTHAGARTGSMARQLFIGFDPIRSFAFLKQLLRVSRGWVLCFCALEQLGDYKFYAATRWVRAGVWHRRGSRRSFLVTVRHKPAKASRSCTAAAGSGGMAMANTPSGRRPSSEKTAAIRPKNLSNS